MLVKRLKAKHQKHPAGSTRSPARKQRILKPEFTPEEVDSFELQAARHQQSESAWQRLSSPPEEGERWVEAVEEHLLYKDQAHDHAQRRWKYFSK